MHVLYAKCKQLFELIRFVKLPQAQVLQDCLVGWHSHSNDRFIPCCIEGLHVVASELNFKIWEVLECSVRVTDLEMVGGHPCDLSPRQEHSLLWCCFFFDENYLSEVSVENLHQTTGYVRVSILPMSWPSQNRSFKALLEWVCVILLQLRCGNSLSKI